MKTKLLQKTKVIGGIGSPVNLLSRERIEAEKILISYGGGMGGANQRFYGNVTHITPKDIFFKKVTGGEVCINKEFIVNTEPVQIFIELWDTTERTNYDGSKCKKSTHQRILAFSLEYEITFNDKEFYTNGDDAVIDTFDTIE